MSKHILAIDQGTTSSKALVLDDEGRIAGESSGDYRIDGKYPQPGWVEYEPAQMLETVRDCAISAIANAGLEFSDIAAIGLANQGETAIAFDGGDGIPLGPAISWEDRRTVNIVDRWRAEGLTDAVHERTGLRLDPYFSASKLKWFLENIPRASELLRAGRLRLGTSDAWLLWQLTGGKSYITDVATASRTLLLNLARLEWDTELCAAFGVPLKTLPSIVENSGTFGVTQKDLFGCELPITGLCVDQQASLFGHGCCRAGEAKATYGTGCFLLANIGTDAFFRARGLITNVGWQVSGDTSYVAEGGVYSVGSALGWLEKIGLLGHAREIDSLLSGIDDAGGVMMIPAFSGLAAPHWQSRARACWVGMHTGTEREHLIRAAIESIAYRVKDIHESMRESGLEIGLLRVDGGLTRCKTLMQAQTDTLNVPLQVSECPQVTALGVGLFAGLGAGIWDTPSKTPRSGYEAGMYSPRSNMTGRAGANYERWRKLCGEICRWSEDDTDEGV